MEEERKEAGGPVAVAVGGGGVVRKFDTNVASTALLLFAGSFKRSFPQWAKFNYILCASLLDGLLHWLLARHISVR